MAFFQYKYLGFAAMSAAAFAFASCATPQSDTGQSSAAKIREARFTSTPPGAVVAIYGLKDDPRKILPKICKTPCSQNLDSNKSWRATALMADGTNEDLPVTFHPLDKTGMGIDFTTEAPFQVVLNTLEAVPLNTENSMYVKSVAPIRRIPRAGPLDAGKSGRCTMIYDITAKGIPTNIRTKSCSDNLFMNSGLKMIAGWSFEPRLRNGAAVGVTGVEQKTVFQILGRDGKTLPE